MILCRMIVIGEQILFLILFIMVCGIQGSRDASARILSATRRREPNNVQCFKNSDCLSDCCISNNGWVGICVGKPQIGQICGLFTTANSGNNNLFGSAGSQPQSNPWGNNAAWSYGGVLGNMLMNPGASGGGGGQQQQQQQQQQPQPSARPQNPNGGGGNSGGWDLSALLSNNGGGGSGRSDMFDSNGGGGGGGGGMMQGYHHGGGGGGGGMDYGGYGHQQGGHHQNGGFNMNSFDLSSLKYGNKFGKRFDYDMYG